MRLYLTEKPSAARQLAAVLGSHRHIRPGGSGSFAGHIEGEGWRIAYLSGHFYQLLEPHDIDPKWRQWSLATLPIIQQEVRWKRLSESDFPPISEIQAQIEHVSSLYESTTDIVIATDSGQEGQVIGQVFVQETGWNGPTLRLWTSAWESTALARNLNTLRPNSDFQGHFNAGVARSLADQLIGVNFTRLYTLKARQAGYDTKVRCGSVRSPAMSIVVDQDALIEQHKSAEYYSLKASLSIKGEPFAAQLIAPEHLLDDGSHCFDRSAMLNLLERVKEQNEAVVASCQAKDTSQAPPAPFNQNTLSQFCSEQFQMMPDEVLKASQALYEAGHMSYPRVEDTFYESHVLEQAPAIAQMLKGLSEEFSRAVSQINLNTPQPVFDDAQIEEHSALYVTPKAPDLSKLSAAQRNVYTAVAMRLLAQFASPLIIAQTRAVFSIDTLKFSAESSQLVDKGWSTLVSYSGKIDSALPAFKEGDLCSIEEITLQAKKTKAPPRYTVARFQETLKDCTHLLSPKIRDRVGKGQLGTGATQPTYLPSLVEQGVLQIQDKKYVLSTKRGREVRHLLPGTMTSPNLRAVWEERFRAIRAGKEGPEAFIQQVCAWITEQVLQGKKLNFKPSPTITPCPKCSSALNRKTSSKNKDYRFYICSNDDCDFFAPDHKGKPIELLPGDGTDCPKCGAVLRTKLRRMQQQNNNTDANRFLGCSGRGCGYICREGNNNDNN